MRNAAIKILKSKNKNVEVVKWHAERPALKHLGKGLLGLEGWLGKIRVIRPRWRQNQQGNRWELRIVFQPQLNVQPETVSRRQSYLCAFAGAGTAEPNLT